MERISRVICGVIAAIPYGWVLVDNFKSKPMSMHDVAIVLLIIVGLLAWLFITGYAISGNKFLHLFRRVGVNQEIKKKFRCAGCNIELTPYCNDCRDRR